LLIGLGFNRNVRAATDFYWLKIDTNLNRQAREYND